MWKFSKIVVLYKNANLERYMGRGLKQVIYISSNLSIYQRLTSLVLPCLFGTIF